MNFAIAAIAFVKRLRTRALTVFFRQEVAWHDQEENNSTALCTRLSTDADDVKRVSHHMHFNNSLKSILSFFFL
jgi:hypothetical protein